MPEKPTLDQDVMWDAVQNRNGEFDGRFFFGVLTTGVYCRPSCACRLPLRKNVQFFSNVAAAERAGLRACKRCRPGEPSLNTRMLESAEDIRKHSDSELRLVDMARKAGLSPFHFQRSFKAVMGLTPKQYLDGCRLGDLKSRLRAEGSVTDAIYETGFGSSSRVYERVDTHLGMTPKQYRSGGEHIEISYASVNSALGRMMIGATDRGICFIQFGESEDALVRMLGTEYPAATLAPMPEDSAAQFSAWMNALEKHVAGERPHLDLPLDLRATAFQLKVWRYLQTIPYGSVKSYSEVALELGQPGAARAVARACASNRVALLIPCHRVIRGSGDLAGYKWGLDRKRTLIDRERACSGRTSI